MIQTHNITQDWAFKEAFEVWKTQKSKQKCRQETQKTKQKQDKTKNPWTNKYKTKQNEKRKINEKKSPLF